MNIPKLELEERSREYNRYSQIERDSVIYNYLFNGFSHRKLDKDILKLYEIKSKGWQSMGILHHLGIKDDFKGLFKDKSLVDAIQELTKVKSDAYNMIIQSLCRYKNIDSLNAIYDSWQIISNSVAIKTTDKSVFEYHGSGIPKETRFFWNIDKLESGNSYPQKLLYKGHEYDVYFQRESKEPYRTRLFWHSDFQNVIINSFPDYKKYEVNKEKYPLMRFEKYEKNIYQINFLVTEYINTDIDSDTEEHIHYDDEAGNKEGKSNYFYVKKYERDKKNRLNAIKIHGTKCVCCGFDFEKTYGERGAGYIEIHHNKPLFSLNEEVIINPFDDLVPVCSNCHRIIHRKKDDVLSIDEVKKLIIKYKDY